MTAASGHPARIGRRNAPEVYLIGPMAFTEVQLLSPTLPLYRSDPPSPIATAKARRSQGPPGPSPED